MGFFTCVYAAITIRALCGGRLSTQLVKFRFGCCFVSLGMRNKGLGSFFTLVWANFRPFELKR